jgi:hypothetical protein
MSLPVGAQVEVWREGGHARAEAILARLRDEVPSSTLTERGSGTAIVVLLLVTGGLVAPNLDALGEDVAVVPAWLDGDWSAVAPDELREATPIDLRGDDPRAWQALLDAISNAANLAGL